MRFLRSKSPSLLNDTEIIAAYRKHHESAMIAVLFDRYSHLVFGVSFNYLKDEDECKDAVLQIFENLARDLMKYEIKNFPSWLHVVTKNYCLRQLAKKKNTIPITHENYVEETEEAPEINIFLPNLSGAMLKLNEEQRLCVEMFYLREMSYKEITDKTGYDLNQVKSYIQNGKRNLKLILLNKK